MRSEDFCPANSAAASAKLRRSGSIRVTTRDDIKLSAFAELLQRVATGGLEQPVYRLPAEDVRRNKGLPGEAGDMIYHLGCRDFVASGNFVRRLQGKFAVED